MILKRLEITGFKSFAKKTQFVFDCSTTAIVGPNGSGKSNVAEALKWVLGEQSFKSIRGKRGEDFIFSGTNLAQRTNYAKVVITFENRDGSWPGKLGRPFNLDFDEVSIGREVHRDGANNYYLNGSRVRLKDIVELLSQVSLGASQHHIVSQGDADRFLSADPLERREMIEDALGIKIFEYKKEESRRKLEKSIEHIKEVETVRREIAPHLKFLEKQVAEIRKAEEIKKELCELYRVYFTSQASLIHFWKERNKSEREVCDRDTERIKGELNHLAAIETSNEKNELYKNIRGFEGELSYVRLRRSELSREIGRSETLVETRNEQLQELSGAVKAEVSDNKPISFSLVSELLSGALSRINEALEGSDIARVKSLLRVIKESLVEFLGKHKREENDEIRRKLGVFESEVKEKRSYLDKLRADLTLEDELEKSLIGKVADCRERLSKMESERTEAERRRYRLEAEKLALDSKKMMLDSSRAEMEGIESEFKRDQTEAAVVAGRDALSFGRVEMGLENVVVEKALQDGRRKKIERLKIRLEEMGVGGDDVLREYDDTKDRDAFLERELGDLRNTCEALEGILKDLTSRIEEEFNAGMIEINKAFGMYFIRLFEGGSASLAMSKPKRIVTDDDVNEGVTLTVAAKDGVDITLAVPKKKIMRLESLSGGEKTLVSIAFIFALVEVKPPPFLVLDETDAALDEANSKRYGDVIDSISKTTQLVLVTHNRETMSHASALYGISMGPDGVSRQLSIKFEEASAMAAR